MILTPQIFSKNLKFRAQYFFGTHYDILRGKKPKIVRVTARSIWVGMPHIVILPILKLLRTNGLPFFRESAVKIFSKL